MIPVLAVVLAFQAKGDSPLPSPTPITLPDEVRDWKGFKFLPDGPRTVDRGFPVTADWSGVKGDLSPNAVEWRAKVVLLDRVDRPHELGPNIVWPGHHAILSPTAAWIKRALPQLRALVASETGGAVKMKFDVSEESEPITAETDFSAQIANYLAPRMNGGKYQAEDGVFRGPYQSVFMIHPAGGIRIDPRPFEVQGAPVSVLGLPDLVGQEADGVLASWMMLAWRSQALRRFEDTGIVSVDKPETSFDWSSVVLGQDVSTESRLRPVGPIPNSIASAIRENPEPWAKAPRGEQTNVRLAKDPQRGTVLVVEEASTYRAGGVVLPRIAGKSVDVSAATTFAFWMKSDAKDPIDIRFFGNEAKPAQNEKDQTVTIGIDVPFVYDGQWHRVKIDLKPLVKSIDDIDIGPIDNSRAKIKNTLGPIVASFSDFELTTETPDSTPTPEAPNPVSKDPEVRARWAATAEPGEERRKLLRDPIDAVKANAVAAALAKPDPADEPMLIEDALYTFEPTVFTPAIRALANAKTPAATAALKQAIRIAASDRARGLAAEVLAESGESNLAPTFVGLNQAHSREARLSAIRALAKLPGNEAILLRMSYLAQDDPEIKLAVTLTIDPNDDYQGRKLLWSAVNEPSDAVRLESLRRLSSSIVESFRAEGLKGVRDDSVGVRIGLLEAWTQKPSADLVSAIRNALTDREPRVRAAALAALATNGSEVTPKDVLFDDPDPRVQLAALKLAKAKSIPVPDEVRIRLSKSPDAQVRAAVG